LLSLPQPSTVSPQANNAIKPNLEHVVIESPS